MLNSPNQLQYNMLNGASSMSSLDFSKQFGKQVNTVWIGKSSLNGLTNTTSLTSDVQNLTTGDQHIDIIFPTARIFVKWI